jgi:hypothetical protein
MDWLQLALDEAHCDTAQNRERAALCRQLGSTLDAQHFERQARKAAALAADIGALLGPRAANEDEAGQPSRDGQALLGAGRGVSAPHYDGGAL